MARTKRPAFRVEPIELRAPKDIPHKSHYGQANPEPLDAPSAPCSSQQLNDRALVAFEDDARDVLRKIISEGLKEVCCGDHSHGLLHEAVRLEAWNCISILLYHGWESNRRLRFWMKAGAPDQSSRPDGVVDSMLSLWESIGANNDRVMEFSNGERYMLRRSGTVLECMISMRKYHSLTELFDSGADPDGDLLEQCIKAMKGEEKMIPPIKNTYFIHYALNRDRFDLVRALIQDDDGTMDLDIPFHALSTDAVLFASGISNISENMLTFETVAQMIEEHQHDTIQWLLAELGVVDTRRGMLWWQEVEPIYLRLLAFAIDQSCQFSRDLILDLCPSLNLDGYSDHATLPLHQAAQSPHEDADDIRVLLDRGANPDRPMTSEYAPDPEWLPIRLRRLIGAGAATRQFTFPVYTGDTALHIVAKANVPLATRMTRVSLLIAAGASLNIRNSQGNTPLHCHAARAGFKDEDFEDIKRLLVHAGADVTVRNNAGYTADELRVCVAHMVKHKPSKKTGPAVHIESPPPTNLDAKEDA